MKRIHRLLFSVLSGILLSLPWLGFPGWILFVAFVPLFFVERFFVENKDLYPGVSFWGHAFLSFVIWNGLTTWWIVYATVIGVLTAVIVNAFLMSLVLWLAHFARHNLRRSLGYIALLAFWVSFEYFHFNWDIQWPWLTLGNGFANNARWIQWYEFTGVFGGTFWVLVVNFILLGTFVGLQNKEKGRIIVSLFLGFLLIGIPAFISKKIYNNYTEEKNPKDIVVVQPNINPYDEEYSLAAENKKLEKFVHLAEEKADEQTDFILGPETTVENYFRWNVDDLKSNPQYLKLKDFQNKYPNVDLMFGVASSKFYKGEEDASSTARLKDGKYYDVFNSAVFMKEDGETEFYHKSVLVSGVEKVPFAKYFGFLKNVFIDLGGASGNLGSQQKPSVFIAEDSTVIAPVICFESVFGEYVSEYVKKGAELIFVITNDGWWKKSPGYKQHCSFSRLRAIETRRSIARAANTGISCFINQRGDIIQKSSWWQAASLSGRLNLNDKITFYVKNGDYIARILVFVSVLLLLLLISGELQKDKKNPHQSHLRKTPD